jgi:lipopolysaccharide/colanic/teichoic acid biosynthesis glycosyltransferase
MSRRADTHLKRRLALLVLLLLGLIALAPLLLLVALAIRLEDGGPVLFAQRRVGRGNRFFLVFKFRSMTVARQDPDGETSTRRDDNRVTRVGRWIRRTSIDELPQLLNVLKGEMSIVGPRPHALGSQAGEKLFWEVDDQYWTRHALKPGLTGLAQVRGLRGATDHESDLARRLSSDLEYLSGWSIWRDLAIVFATLKVLIHHKAY